ncbi:MAG: glycosyltransferase family 2 protein [Clostridium sp.]
MKPKISIIVPVYNVEKYLKKCIESILAQTFEKFELILVNDGSTDNCGKIIDEYEKKDKRIKVIHKKNGGLSSARNAGLDLAQGEYIGFVDSDDWIDVDMYEVLYDLITKSGKDIANVGYTRVTNTYNDSWTKHDEKILSRDEAMYELINHKLFGNSFCMNLFRASLIKKFRFQEGIIFEDVDLIYKVIHKSNGMVTIGLSKYNYVQRESSIVAIYKSKYNIDLILCLDRRIEFLKKNYSKLYEDHYNLIYNDNLFFKVYDTFIEILRKENEVEEWKVEELTKILNKYFYQNMKLNISKSVKVLLILLKINKILFVKILKMLNKDFNELSYDKNTAI